MRKLARLPLLSGLVCLTLLAAACSGADAQEGGAKVKLSATNLLPPKDAQSETIQWFMDELELRTDGEVETEVVHAGALLAGDDTLAGLKQGRADAGNIVPHYFPADLPLHNALAVPVEANQSVRLKAIQANFDNVEAWRAELENQQLELIGYNPNPSSAISFTRQVNSLDDVKGLKIRVPSEIDAALWQQFGVEPTYLASNEVYEYVERGILDGALYTMGSQVSTGVTDVAKFMAPAIGQSGSGTFALSKRAYDKLSDRAKEVVEELKGEWYEKADEMLTKYEAQACETFLEGGGTIHLWSESELQRMNAMMPEATEMWRKSAMATGVDEADVDESWESYQSSLSELADQSEYTDGMIACYNKQ